MPKSTPRRRPISLSVRAQRFSNASFETLESRTMLSASPNPVMTPMFLSPAGESAAPAFSASPPAGSTTPTQMRRFYSADNINFNGVPGDGRGMTIAIVDAYDYPSAWGDLQAFDSFYGLPNPPSFQVLNQFGQTTNLPTAAPTGSWAIEAALDIQWAHVMAPLANIVLVEAQSDFTSDLFDAVTTAAGLPNVVCVSMSFGTPEVSFESTWDSSFTTPAGHNGVTFLAATGDHGSPGTYPAFSPNVVAVGGTSINLGSDGTYVSESAWSGSGGGASAYEPRPFYQNGIQNSLFRATPDLSMDADPATGAAVYDSYDHGVATPWWKYGGTSLATPMFAGLVAIADQGRVSVGQSRLDGATQVIPTLYSMSTSKYHDVTTGGSTNGANAAVGYDLATGIGTPIGNTLVNQLATATSTLPQVTGTSGNDNFTLTLDPNHLYVNWSNGIASGQVAAVDLNGLTITGSGGNDTLTLNYASGSPLPNSLKLNGNFTLLGLQGTNPLAGKSIDITQGKLFIDYAAGPSLLNAVQQYITNGYNNGAWNGLPTVSSGVIRSSAAALNPGAFALGFADNATDSAANPNAHTVEVMYTFVGDANLDGRVNLADVNIIGSNFNSTTANWDQGDFNFDRRVNLADVNSLGGNFNQSFASLVPAVTPSTTTPSSTTTTSTTPKTLPTATPPHGRWSNPSPRPLPANNPAVEDAFDRLRKKLGLLA